jgi:hypothetical protein
MPPTPDTGFQLELSFAQLRQINAISYNTEVSVVPSMSEWDTYCPQISRLAELLPRDCKESRYAFAMLKRTVCVPGTRQDVLGRITSWCKDTSPGSAAIYWLNGMAGTGKSTIAYTICRQLVKEGKTSPLGASFFCSRQRPASRQQINIIPTIAHELALKLPQFREKLLYSGADANLPPLDEHLQCLLVEPWEASIADREGLPPLVVVLDALDELENEDGSHFLEALINAVENHGDHLSGLKFLVTSRRDPRIVEIGKALSPSTVYGLEDMPSATADHDIGLYLRTSLPGFGDDQLQPLTKQASGLFIYAVTAVRFIVQFASSTEVQKNRLQLLLTFWPDETRRGPDGLSVDDVYEEVLKEWLSQMAPHYKPIAVSILHTVLCAQERVLLSDIPEFLNEVDKREMDVKDVIGCLHAVLYISEDHVYWYHKSFLDFMFAPTRWANQELAGTSCVTCAVDVRFTASCFRLMDTLRSDDSNISSSVSYACRHWAAHLSKIPTTDQTTRNGTIALVRQWLDTRFMFWMQAMKLLGKSRRCNPALITTSLWLPTVSISVRHT